MKPEIKSAYVNYLRLATTPQVVGAELVIFPDSAVTQGIDAWGALCSMSPWFASVKKESGSETNYFYTERAQILAWSGLTAEELDELIEMNDVLGLSFSQIADAIEQDWQ